MTTSLLTEYGDDFDDEQYHDSLYQAYIAGITLPHHWGSPTFRQINLDYLTKHHPEYLL